MIFDTFDGLTGDSHDVCIVGAGPVGISLAIELERLGSSVLLIESGRRTADSSIQKLSDAEIVSACVHHDMSIAVARRLGGTSNLWGARCLKFDPIDFLPRPGLVDVEWPISYEELFPYYDRACEYTRSGAPVYKLPVPGVRVNEGSFTFETLERWGNEQKLQVIHGRTLTKSKQIDVRLQTTVVDISFHEDGRVNFIEIARSDGTLRRRIPVRNLVIAAGGLESTRLLLAAQRQAPERFGGPDGPLGRHYMGHVTGEIADIVFANPALDAAFDFFVDDHGSYVRRRFVPSGETQLCEQVLNVAMWPVVPPVADPRHGNGLLSLIYLSLAIGPIGRMIVAEAIRKRHIPEKPVNTVRHLENVVRELPSALMLSADFLMCRYARKTRIPGFFVRNKSFRYGLFYHSEQIPNPDSRVTLSGTLDRTGLPKLRVDLRFLDADAQSVVRVHALFENWLKLNGFGTLDYRVPVEERVAAVLAQARHGSHQIGTVRMASSRRVGVVDHNLRSFDSPNLFVVSAAVLPTSGQASPTLTVIALAVRLAQTLARASIVPVATSSRKRG